MKKLSPTLAGACCKVSLRSYPRCTCRCCPAGAASQLPSVHLPLDVWRRLDWHRVAWVGRWSSSSPQRLVVMRQSVGWWVCRPWWRSWMAEGCNASLSGMSSLHLHRIVCRAWKNVDGERGKRGVIQMEKPSPVGFNQSRTPSCRGAWRRRPQWRKNANTNQL